jgi:hypothetical protein
VEAILTLPEKPAYKELEKRIRDLEKESRLLFSAVLNQLLYQSARLPEQYSAKRHNYEILMAKIERPTARSSHHM